MNAVTVVVASMNRREDLLRSLPNHEPPVILVDNGSTDGTVPAVRAAFPSVRVIALRKNLAGAARNIGVEAASTPYVAFADDDSWWAPGALDKAAALLDEHPRVAVLAGRMLVGPSQRLDPMSASMAAAPLGSPPHGAGPDVLGFAACAAVVRRSAFLSVGGFGPVVRFPGEEERVAYDLVDRGWILSYVDDLVAHHHPSPRRSDPASRQRVITRNALLTAVQRRPWPAVASRALADWRAGGPRRAGALSALRSVPLALRHRHRVGPEVERRIRLLADLPPH